MPKHTKKVKKTMKKKTVKAKKKKKVSRPRMTGY